jgi:integrase
LRSYLLAATERDELPKPRRLRYTLEEGLRILAAAPAIDPRLDLMLWLAPNQRLGQVVRTRRSHVDLVANELRIPGRGQKRGPVISMTEGERHALDDAFATGYLRLLEAAFLAGEIADYPLFPSGQMPGIRALRRGFGTKAGAPPSWRAPEHPTATVERHAGAKPVVRRTIGEWWALAEARAEVSHLEGRGPYGVRRMFTDESKKRKISREGLTAMGGWSDPQMADRVYADDDARYAREEARDVRASIRGEPASSADNSAIPTGNLQQSSNTALQTEGGV